MKRFSLVVLTALVTFAIAFVVCSSQITYDGGTAPDGTYIPFRNGEESKVLLVDYQLRYGVYDIDLLFPTTSQKAVKGDRAVIIEGTIRNDYEEDYYIAITADVYNSEGERVGTILSPSAPIPGFAVTFVTRASVSPFEIWVKYDRQDVADYELFLPYRPSTWPFP